MDRALDELACIPRGAIAMKDGVGTRSDTETRSCLRETETGSRVVRRAIGPVLLRVDVAVKSIRIERGPATTSVPCRRPESSTYRPGRCLVQLGPDAPVALERHRQVHRGPPSRQVVGAADVLRDRPHGRHHIGPHRAARVTHLRGQRETASQGDIHGQ